MQLPHAALLGAIAITVGTFGMPNVAIIFFQLKNGYLVIQEQDRTHVNGQKVNWMTTIPVVNTNNLKKRIE